MMTRIVTETRESVQITLDFDRSLARSMHVNYNSQQRIKSYLYFA